MVRLQHLDIIVLRQAVLADRREVRRLPAGAVQILLDLRRHGEEVTGRNVWWSSVFVFLCVVPWSARKWRCKASKKADNGKSCSRLLKF